MDIFPMQTWLIWSLISFLHPNSYIPPLWIRQVRLSIFLSTLSHFSSRTTTVASPEALLWLSSCELGSLKWQHWCCEPESRRRDGKLLPLKRKPGSLLETVPTSLVALASQACFAWRPQGLLLWSLLRSSSSYSSWQAAIWCLWQSQQRGNQTSGQWSTPHSNGYLAATTIFWRHFATW